MRIRLNFRFLTISILSLVISACSSSSKQTTTYYQFTAKTSDSSTTLAQKNALLTVSPTTLPDFINTQGITLWTEQNQVINANWHQWAQSPSKMLTQTAIAELQSDLPRWLVTQQELTLPTMNKDNRWRLAMTLERFGGTQNSAVIIGNWQLFDHQGNLVERKSINQNVALNEDGYPALVKALESAWINVVNDIAITIDTLD